MGYASDNRSRFESRGSGGGRYGGGGGGRSEGRGYGGGRGGYGGGRGGYGGGRGGFGGGRDRERRPLEMHEAICAKCGKQCEVPFKPTGDKPVYCRECFNKDGDLGRSGGGRDFGSRDRERGPSQSAGVSSAQLNEINKKLDKIIKALEIDSDEEDEEDEDEDEEDEEVK